MRAVKRAIEQDDGDERRAKTPRSSGQPTPGSQPSQSIVIDSDDDEDEQGGGDNNDDDDLNGNEAAFMTQADEVDPEAFEMYGTIYTKVVGIRYYDGHAADGESVLLRREPHNPYDGNAMQVLNVGGSQIGHIPRQVAAKLAPYVDLQDLLLEGQLAGARGEFDVPLRIAAFGPSDFENKERVKAEMKRDRLPMDDLKRRDKEAKKKRTAELKKAAKTEKDRKKATQWMNGAKNPNDGNGETDESNEIDSQSIEDIISESRVINSREIGQAVEQFGTQEDDLAAMPEAEKPERVSTKMLPYQKQALAWLLDKEDTKYSGASNEEVVQLWKKKTSGSRTTYTNIATNHTTSHLPKFARGGILADDMGLGKTLEMISLILADKDKFGEQGPTLIVAPVSVMSNWSQQIERHVSQTDPLRVYVYHGSGRKKMKPAEFKKFDVIITTYGTLSVEYMPKGSKKLPKKEHSSGLYSLQWRRMILDEGHNIRNPNTKNAIAACAVDSYAKWTLTGTPIINSLKDLYSLVRFIGLTGGLERFELFNGILIRPIRDGDSDAQVLLQALMGTFCLRRRKDMSFVDLRLPELTEYVHRVKFPKHERKKYDALQEEAKGTLDTFKAEAGQKAQHAYRHLLEVLLRLRQVCNHWKLCEERVSSLMTLLEKQKCIDLTPENRRALQDLLQLSIEQREECVICFETLHNPVITHCGHIFGNECITRVIETQRTCPMCRAELRDETKLVPPAVEYGDDASDPNLAAGSDVSAKMQALVNILSAARKKSGSKVVIFSQWCRFLDLIQPHLEDGEYQFARLDGSMSATKRDAALRSFDSEPETTIMLASLGVCAVGLNLVAADTVILCDSWWAPAIEDQAVDRVHRLGQTRPTTVWRLVMEDSVEERTLEIQKDKRELMAMALKEGPDERKRREGGRSRTVGDIQRLLD